MIVPFRKLVAAVVDVLASALYDDVSIVVDIVSSVTPVSFIKFEIPFAVVVVKFCNFWWKNNLVFVRQNYPV